MQQQIGACCHSVGLSPDTDAMMLTGEDLPETRAELWRRRRLIFCTPHILRNDLANGLVDGKRIVLQHAQSAPLAGAPQLASCASSARPWWLWAACTPRGEVSSPGAQPPLRVLGRAASKATDSTACGHPGPRPDPDPNPNQVLAIFDEAHHAASEGDPCAASVDT